MESEEPSLQEILETGGGIREEEVYNIYLTGSRVYGTHSPSSDWDYVMIVKDTYSGGKMLYDSLDKLNVLILSLSHFRLMLLSHHHLSFYLLFLPPPFVLLQLISRRELMEGWILDVSKLKRSHFQKASSSLNRAKFYSNMANNEINSNPDKAKELLRKSKKMICHSLRFLHFGLQVIEYGEIRDYTVANNYWYHLQNMNTYLWSSYEAYARPIYLQLRNKYPDVPVATIDIPPELPKLFTNIYRFVHDSGCSSVEQSVYEKEILQIIRNTTEDNLEEQFEELFPDYVETYQRLKKEFYELCEKLEKEYEEIVGSLQHENDPKEFADKAKNSSCKTVMFNMRKKNCSCLEYLSQCCVTILLHTLHPQNTTKNT